MLRKRAFKPAFLSGLLGEAASRGNVPAIRLLASNGAECLLPVKSEWGQPALHSAAYGGHPAAVSCLLSFGADPHVRDSYNMTALHYAATAPHSRREDVDLCVRILLSSSLGYDIVLSASQLLGLPSDRLARCRLLDNEATLFHGMCLTHAAAASGLVWLLNLAERVAGRDLTGIPDAFGMGLYYHALLNAQLEFAVSLYNRAAPFAEQSYLGAAMGGVVDWFLMTPLPPQLVVSPPLPELRVGEPQRFEAGVLYVGNMPESVLHYMQNEIVVQRGSLLTCLCSHCSPDEIRPCTPALLRRVPRSIMELADALPPSEYRGMDLQLVVIASLIAPHVTGPSPAPSQTASCPCGPALMPLSIDGSPDVLDVADSNGDIAPVVALQSRLPLLTVYLLRTFPFSLAQRRTVLAAAIRGDFAVVVEDILSRGDITPAQQFRVAGRTVGVLLFAARHVSMATLRLLGRRQHSARAVDDFFSHVVRKDSGIVDALTAEQRLDVLSAARPALAAHLHRFSSDEQLALGVCRLFFEALQHRPDRERLSSWVQLFHDFLDVRVGGAESDPGSVREPEPECPGEMLRAALALRGSRSVSLAEICLTLLPHDCEIAAAVATFCEPSSLRALVVAALHESHPGCPCEHASADESPLL